MTLSGGSAAFACERAGEMLEAIASNSVATLTSILQSGEDPNCTGKDDDTMLGAAVKNRNVPMIEILLKYKADVNQTDGARSPLYLAASADCAQCADILISAGGKFIADEDQIQNLRKYSHIKNSVYWNRIINPEEGN